MRRTPALAFVMSFAASAASAQTPDQTGALLQRPAHAVVHLQDDAKGVCAITATTDLVTLSKARRAVVEFVIVNDCAAAVEVSVSGLRHEKEPKAADPMLEGAVDRKRQVQSGQIVRSLKLTARRDAVEGVWTYSLSLGNQAADPKIDIER